jgi:hypothetical protein
MQLANVTALSDRALTLPALQVEVAELGQRPSKQHKEGGGGQSSHVACLEAPGGKCAISNPVAIRKDAILTSAADGSPPEMTFHLAVPPFDDRPFAKRFDSGISNQNDGFRQEPLHAHHNAPDETSQSATPMRMIKTVISWPPFESPSAWPPRQVKQALALGGSCSQLCRRLFAALSPSTPTFRLVDGAASQNERHSLASLDLPFMSSAVYAVSFNRFFYLLEASFT